MCRGGVCCNRQPPPRLCDIEWMPTADGVTTKSYLKNRCNNFLNFKSQCSKFKVQQSFDIVAAGRRCRGRCRRRCRCRCRCRRRCTLWCFVSCRESCGVRRCRGVLRKVDVKKTDLRLELRKFRSCSLNGLRRCSSRD